MLTNMIGFMLKVKLHFPMQERTWIFNTHRVFFFLNPVINPLYLHAFFYKNKLYKNTQAEICPEIKNKLRTITRLKF